MAILDSVGERLARGVDRRHFLRRAAETGFVAATSWAAMSGRAQATGSCPDARGACYCFPPGVGYCDPTNQCKGWRCRPPCTYNYRYYPDACWCTKECPNFDGSSRGWYKCCDCYCGSNECGCRKYVQTCSGPAGSC
jgi:hypothetical protein